MEMGEMGPRGDIHPDGFTASPPPHKGCHHSDIKGLPGMMSPCWAGPPALEPRTRSQLLPVTRSCDPRASPWTGFNGGPSRSSVPSPIERLTGTGWISTVSGCCCGQDPGLRRKGPGNGQTMHYHQPLTSRCPQLPATSWALQGLQQVYHGAHAQKVPPLVQCSAVADVKFLIIFDQGPHFHLALGPPHYAASTAHTSPFQVPAAPSLTLLTY